MLFSMLFSDFPWNQPSSSSFQAAEKAPFVERRRTSPVTIDVPTVEDVQPKGPLGIWRLFLNVFLSHVTLKWIVINSGW